MSDQRRGFILGVTAYGLWGAFPLYFPLLEPAGADEILAHRILWSALTMGILVVALGRLPHFLAIVRTPRTRSLLIVGAMVITSNWATYIWGVNHDHVVETSLGYFINPLVTVLMGVFILGETMRRLQWAALGVAALAVVVLTVDYGRPPWIALILAFSFGSYGLAKKQADAGAVESLAFETAVLTPFAAAYVGWLVVSDQSTFGVEGGGHALLLASMGIVTAIPLICFGAAATRLSMVTLGLLQFLAPVLQFLVGLLIVGEEMPVGRWIGFSLVWLALVVFTVESINHRRRQLALVAQSSAM
jgi:chloramphenicol-sensitive protein RarD